MSDAVLLVGVGFMGRAYGTVLRELGRPVIAIGRSQSGVAEFESATGLKAHPGGVDQWLSQADVIPESAIVCVSTDEAPRTCAAVLAAGVKRILLEKPGGSSPLELARMAEVAASASAEVVVGYNRRFYSSTLEAERRIASEGGVTSIHFEFTERERDATLGKFSKEVREHWVLANSSHVIDLAFFLAGEPVRLSAEVSGSLAWHPSAACFAGSGMTASNALFSYCANWASGGRWGVEVMTGESRLILRPLETLQVQLRGVFRVDPVEIADDLDVRFKPGLYRQTQAFLNRDQPHRFIGIAEQARRAGDLYARISGQAAASLSERVNRLP